MFNLPPGVTLSMIDNSYQTDPWDKLFDDIISTTVPYCGGENGQIQITPEEARERFEKYPLFYNFFKQIEKFMDNDDNKYPTDLFELVKKLMEQIQIEKG